MAVPTAVLLVLFIGLQFPAVQNSLAKKAVSYVSEKTGGAMSLKSLGFNLSGAIEIEDLLVRDQKKDTLLFSHHLSVSLDLPALFSKHIQLNSVELDGFTGRVQRNNAGFNFDFIADAFASGKKENTEPADTSGEWTFSLKRVQLRHIYATYDDAVSGVRIRARVGGFKTRIKKMDLPRQRLDIGDVRLDSSWVWLEQKAVPGDTSTEVSEAPAFRLNVSDVDISHTRFAYKGYDDGIDLNANVGSLLLKMKEIDLAHYRFDALELTLSNSSVTYLQEAGLPKKDQLSAPSASSATIPWEVKLAALQLENNVFAYEDKNKPSVRQGMDYNHLQVNHLNVKARRLYVSEDKITGKIDKLSLEEKSGFVLRELRSEILYDSRGHPSTPLGVIRMGSGHMALKDLHLLANNSRIAGNLALRYSSLEALSDSVGTAGVTLNFDSTRVAAADLVYFVPDLFRQASIPVNENTVVYLDGGIDGTVDRLHFSEFSLRTNSFTSLQLDGELVSITHPKNLYADLSSIQLRGRKQDVLVLLADSLFPTGLELPANFSVNGSFTGYLKNFNAALQVNTSFGELNVKVKMNPEAGNREQPYHIQLNTKAFDLGKLLKQPETLGPLTMKATMDGSGWDTTSLQAQVKLDVEKARIKGYDYQQLALSGTLNKRSFTGQASADDRNLSFVFDGTVDLDPRHPEYHFKLDLKGADLGALHLSEEDLRISAYVESDIRDNRQNNVSGRARVLNLLLLRQNKKYRLDSLVLTSEFKDSLWKVAINSELLKAELKGDITLSQLPGLIARHVNSYFTIQELHPDKHLRPQKFDFEVQLINPAMLAGEVIPRLEKITPASVKGSYNSEAMDLKLKLDLPRIVYSGVTLDSLKINLQSDKEKLNYRLDVAEISTSSLKTENLYLGAVLKNDTLTFQLSTNKDDSTTLISVSGLLKRLPGKAYELSFEPKLIFNAEPWDIRSGNALVFGKEGVYARDLVISSGTRGVTINSAEPRAKAPMNISFTDFDLSTVSRLLENKTDLVRGRVNGTVILEKHGPVPAFRSDLVIGDFAFKAVPVGAIRLKADNFENSQTYRVDLAIEGNGNDIRALGSYRSSGKSGSLDLDVQVNQLELASVEPFTFGQVQRMSGSLKGQLSVKGNPLQPDITGELRFQEASFRPRLIDSYLTIHEGRLAFADHKVRMSHIALYDSLGNKAMLNGFADIRQLNDIRFDMQVNTTNFLALNTDRKDNPLYYGRIFLDSDIRIKGSMQAPDLDVKARLNKGSSFTYVRPQSLVGKSESKGIVEFTDSLHRDTTIMARLNDSIIGITGMKGVKLDATISLDRTVELKIIVDQETGDSLYLVGGGTLDFSLDRDGRTALTGRYRIQDGGYYLAVNDLVKRNFRIERGSTVSWSGDVLDPYVDLKAVYRIKTSPIDLVQEEVSGMGELERNKYRNLLSFLVYLKMTGFISSPEISFDIQLAPGDRGALNGAINSRLAQLREDETELNKQVFALLTLRRFVSENPLDKGDGGGGFSSASRSSASKVLTQQLSSLSDRYVNFVDLDLGVNSFEDYSTGREQGRTQLQVGVSKQLLKDKVTVRVGGNVELEGERASQNNANDVAGNISIDYKLTKDGRYKLKAFRENQYENPIEGELTKTGMGIIYVRNYNKFRELLKKPKQRNRDSFIPNPDTNGNSTVSNEENPGR
jgi:translocation and assembly module TamB